MIRRYMKVQTIVQKAEDEDRREVICDGCGVLVGNDEGFFQVVTHHDRWGNDSGDSYRTRHFCCKKCMDGFLDDYWNDPLWSDQADIEFINSPAFASYSEDDHVETIELEAEE